MSRQQMLLFLLIVLCVVGSCIIHAVMAALHLPLLALPLDILWGFIVGRYLGTRRRK